MSNSHEVKSAFQGFQDDTKLSWWMYFSLKLTMFCPQLAKHYLTELIA